MLRAFSLLAVLLFASSLTAQEDETGKISTGLDLNVSPLRPHSTFSRMLFNLVHDHGVRRELELTAEQVVALDAVFSVRPDQFQEKLRELTIERNLQHASTTERRQLGIEVNEQLQEEALSQLEDVLLPHQIAALEQSAIREIRSRAGTPGLFSTQWIREQLDIDDEQLTRLKKRAEDEARILEEKVKQLKAEAEQNVLEELTSAQREKYMRLIGNDQ